MMMLAMIAGWRSIVREVAVRRKIVKTKKIFLELSLLKQ